MEIRKALAKDLADIGSCHYYCWQETYRGLIDDIFLDGMSETKNRERFKALSAQYMYVLEEDEKIIGFFDVSLAQESFASYEVQGLYLRKAYHGMGYGRQIMDYIRTVCDGKNFYLWCLKTNPTVGYYQHMGGVKIASKAALIGRFNYEEECYLFSHL